MALVGTRVEAIREGNTNLTVKTDILLDPETGLVVERKTVVAEVQTEDGKTAVIAAQKTTVAAVQPRPYPVPQRRAIQTAPAQQQSPQYIIIAPEPPRQPTPQHVTREPPRTVHYSAPPSPQHYRSAEDKCAIHCAFCFFSLFFPPLFCCWLLYCCSSDDN
jgi:hypothetical protein